MTRIRLADTDDRLRKNIYRTRERKITYIAKSVAPSPSKKKHITDNKSLQAFYRYQIVSLISLLSRREDYINSLRGKK